MKCDCDSFCQDLVNFSKDTLIKIDGRPQWEVFEQFCLKYKRNETRSSFPYRIRFCSQTICSLLVRKLNVFIHYDMPLSTLLVDLLTILYSEICARRHVQRLWDASFINSRETLRVMSALRGGWLFSSVFMKLLLNFGLLSSLPIDSPHLTEALDNEFAGFISGIAGYIPNISCWSVREKAMELLVKNNFYHIKNRENLKRMFLVTLALRAIQISLKRNDDLVIDQFISCLKMYFSGTQDALISVFEEFDKLMPECPSKIEPRKLTHLARCQIRQNLKASHLPLPSAVEKLVLPKFLKSYLIGDILELSKKCGNVSSVTLTELELMMSKQ